MGEQAHGSLRLQPAREPRCCLSHWSVYLPRWRKELFACSWAGSSRRNQHSPSAQHTRRGAHHSSWIKGAGRYSGQRSSTPVAYTCDCAQCRGPSILASRKRSSYCSAYAICSDRSIAAQKLFYKTSPTSALCRHAQSAGLHRTWRRWSPEDSWYCLGGTRCCHCISGRAA